MPHMTPQTNLSYSSCLIILLSWEGCDCDISWVSSLIFWVHLAYFPPLPKETFFFYFPFAFLCNKSLLKRGLSILKVPFQKGSKNILTTDSPKSESIHHKNKSKQPCLSNKEKSDQGLHCLLFIQLLTVCIQILLHHSFSKGKVFKYCI